jgi:hypothetical protein
MKHRGYSRSTSARSCAIVAALCAALLPAGCGKPKTTAEEPFQFSRVWQLRLQSSEATLSAELTPQPLHADKPHMLEVRIRNDNSPATPYRVWYRLAHRRGDPLPANEDFALFPIYPPEPGVPPRYDDWFEWAEIIEPRVGQNEVRFTTPVMFSEGKVYVQFRLLETEGSKPQDLLDWFVYVNEAP